MRGQHELYPTIKHLMTFTLLKNYLLYEHKVLGITKYMNVNAFDRVEYLFHITYEKVIT